MAFATPHYAKASPSLLAETPPEAARARLKAASVASEDWASLFAHCEGRYKAMYDWRLPVWITMGEIAEYLLPRRFYPWIVGNVYDQGRRKDFRIVDRHGTTCLGKTAAGLMAGLTDPDRRWLILGAGIPGFEVDQAGQAWYDDLTERYNYLLTHSNFYEAQAQHYEDTVFFGTAPIIDYEDKKDVFRARTPCPGEFLVANGFDNSSEVFYEEFRFTVSQMVEMFGLGSCPKDVQRMWQEKKGALEYQNIVRHAIEPNFDISPNGSGYGVVPGGFTWREVYWVAGKQEIQPLSMCGFHEQPFQTTRWNTQGSEAYGRGLGEDILGDAIQLQMMTRQTAEAREKVNRPPMGADVSLMNQPSATRPGEITYMNSQNGEKKFWPLYEVKPDIQAMEQGMEMLRERMSKTAFNDVFQPMEDLRSETKTQITATEIDAIKEERLLPMGPVFGRIYGTLRFRVKRHLSIMGRAGLIPPKPPSLRGVPLKIEFTSMLTAAQKATRTAAIARSAQFVAEINPTWPEGKFVVDPEATIREFVEGVGAPSSMLHAPQAVKKLIASFNQAQAAAHGLAQTREGAEAAQALGKTPMAPGSALAALVGGAAAPAGQ